MKSIKILSAAAIFLGLSPSLAFAGLLQIDFGGNFFDVADLSPGVTGAASGTVVFDPNAAAMTRHDSATVTTTAGLFYDPTGPSNPAAPGASYNTGFTLAIPGAISAWDMANEGGFIGESIFLLLFDPLGGFNPQGGQVVMLEFVCTTDNCDNYQEDESTRRFGVGEYQVTGNVPVPATWALFAAGLLTLRVSRRKS